MPQVKEVKIIQRALVKMFFNPVVIRKEDTRTVRKQTLREICFKPGERWRLISTDNNVVLIQQVGTPCRRSLPIESWKMLITLPKVADC